MAFTRSGVQIPSAPPYMFHKFCYIMTNFVRYGKVGLKFNELYYGMEVVKILIKKKGGEI